MWATIVGSPSVWNHNNEFESVWIYFHVYFFILITIINHLMDLEYSGTPIVRPPLLHQKSVLSRGVASRQGLKSIHLCLDLHCQVAFPEGVAPQKGFHYSFISLK